VGSRFVLFAFVLLALAACAGASATPSKLARATALSTPKPITIRVTSVVTATRTHRRSTKVATAGDQVEFVDNLLNAEPRFGKKVNEKVGSDRGTMTFTSKSTATMQGAATLPDGTITFNGIVTVLANHLLAIPVTGGTGRYKNASGTLLVGAGSKRAMNTYTLVFATAPGPIA
jgi:hypothetical protein